MLERAIPVQQAFLRIHHGETHHVQRAVAPKKATLIGYGELSADEKEVFKQLVQRNRHNMSFEAVTVKFSSKDQLFDTVKKEIQRWERS